MKLLILLPLILGFVFSPTAQAWAVSCDTNSMYPTLDCNSIEGKDYIKEPANIIGKPTKIYNVGDIIIYKLGSAERFNATVKHNYYIRTSHIIHRIKWYEYDQKGNFIGYTTQGDNNDKPDPWIVRYNWVSWKLVLK